MKKLPLYILIAVVVLGTAGYFLFARKSSGDITYRTEKASRGDVTVQVRATGTINPVRTVKVGSQVSGTISKLFVDFNSVVKQGEIIALIDSTFLAASVKEAQANLERNQAQVNEARRSHARVSELFKKDLVSQADLDAAQTLMETALAQLKQSQAALDRVNVNLRFSVIRAPIDGVVISRDVDVGQTVAASLQAPQLFTIANDLRNMQVEASIDEADIGQIKEGQDVTFTVDAYPEESFTGTVTQIRLAPLNVQNVITYTVIIEVPNPDLKLRPGMTATVSILINTHEDVLRVPTLALRFQPPNDVLEQIEKESAPPGGAPTETAQAGGEERVERPDGNESGMARMREKSEAGADRGMRRRADGDTAPSGNEGRWRMRRENTDGGHAQWAGRGDGDGMHRAGSMKRNAQRARIWVLDGGRNLKAVSVRTGLNDNRFVEILGDGLKEGDDVILSAIGGEAASGMGGQNQQTNPFAPRMPGRRGGM